jgi:PTH2 family peptidyl-tRNA hydrolase
MKIKQVIILRKDLNMRKGKMVAQGAHASMAVLLNEGIRDQGEIGLPTLTIPMNPEMEQWITGIFTKVCVSVDSEDELTDAYCTAKEAGLPASLILDKGLTEFDGVPTYTAVAIGPAKCEEIDKITGELKLL